MSHGKHRRVGIDLSKPMAESTRADILKRLTKRCAINLAGPALCLEWQGTIKNGTHGAMYVFGKAAFVHRLSYAVTNGPIEEGLVVMHLCDNPICILPDHLTLGTQQDNINDMVAKKRHRPRGRDQRSNHEQSYEGNQG